MLVLPERRSITLIFRLFLTVGSPLRHAGQMRFLFDRIAFMVMGIFFILSPYSSVSSTTGISFPAGPLTLTPTGTNVSCYGLNNGKIVSTTTGGAGGAINFTLIPGALTNTTGIFDNLSAGVYVVKADDGTSNATASVTITEPPVSTVPSLTLTSFPTYCPGVTSFSLSYSASNANPVSYSISTGTPALPGFVPVVDAPLGTSPIAVPLPAGVSKGTYQFRLSLKNASGCPAATQTFILNFDDSSAPVWASFPADVSIECGTDSSPVTTGTPTATDNCGSVVVSYTDNVIPGNCPGRSTISRSWKATDQSGNQITRTQSIIINDTTPPVINCTSFTVTNPSDIPAANLNTGITATDNCGTTTIELVSENYIGLNGSAGFCPSSVERTYRAMDQCGNYSSVCKQVITVQSAGTCKVCEDDVPFFPVIFSKPDEIYTSPSVARNGICCNASGPPPPKCISFNVYLHPDAVGLIFKIESGAIPGGALYYQIDCGPQQKVGDVVCLQGGRFHTITFCKPGNNNNVYSIQSISGLTSTIGLTTRADNQCTGQISVTGIVPSTVTWSVKSPNDQSLLRYLSSTNSLTPTFTPDAQAPPTVVYQVCGTLTGAAVCSGNPITDCNEVTVNVLQTIKIQFDTDPGNICQNNIPTIHAEVSPANLNYSYKWFTGSNGTGTLLSSDPFWTPTAEGQYSLVATETQSGVICNTATSNFNVKFDKTGPVVMAPPDTLVIECNDPAAETKIAQWLATAKASDTNISSLAVSNDYSPFVHSCGLKRIVKFWSTDACGNVTEVTSAIRIVDTTAPVFLLCPGPVTATNDPNQIYATGVSLGNPVVTDNCMVQSITNDAPAQFPEGPTIVTWTATDGCGNKTTCKQTVTVLCKPVINCQSDILKNNTPGLCSASLDPGFPVKVSGTAPISYSWSMSGATTASGTGAITPNPFTFNVGVTTISWTATNSVGSATCVQKITVSDTEAPTFVSPPSCSFCVEDLISAGMVSNLLQINPTPDYYLFKKGSKMLDLDPATFSDNCTPASQLEIHWRIDFAGATPPPPVSGIGQPSSYSADIAFPGDGTTFKDVNHTITYWLVDLSGNESVHKTVTITVHPRPVVSYHEGHCISYTLDTQTKLFSHGNNDTQKL